MDECGIADIIGKGDVKLTVRFQRDARCAVRLTEPEDVGGLPIHFDYPFCNGKRMGSDARGRQVKPMKDGCGSMYR